MTTIGGYQTIIPKINHKQISKKGKKSLPKEIKIFVAGGPEIDKKILAVQEDVYKSLKQETKTTDKPKTSKFINYFKTFIKQFIK